MQLKRTLLRALCAGTLAGIAVVVSGCASIVHGGARTITLNTQPEGARATITKYGTDAKVHAGVTPLTVQLNPKRGYFKGQSYSVRFELDGYKTEEVVIRSELSGWYFGNIVFGGLIGMLVVDPATGAMWNLSPDKFDRTLSVEQASLLKTGDGFIVTLLADVNEVERQHLVKVN